jgi:hypothetical protein
MAIAENGAPEPAPSPRVTLAYERALKTAALTEVNDHILDFASESASIETDWDFFCECGELNCHSLIRLTVNEYMDVRDSASAVLAQGHELSDDDRSTRLREGSAIIWRYQER